MLTALYECEQSIPEVCKTVATPQVFLSNLRHLPVKVHLWEILYQHKFSFAGNNCQSWAIEEVGGSKEFHQPSVVY